MCVEKDDGHVECEVDPLDLFSLKLTPTIYVTGWGEWLRLIVW